MGILGIDIGGSGIKGALVNIATGALTAERYRLPTPQPATPDAVADTVAEVVRHFAWKGPIGCALPTVIKDGVTYSAANIRVDSVPPSVCTKADSGTDSTHGCAQLGQ